MENSISGEPLIRVELSLPVSSREVEFRPFTGCFQADRQSPFLSFFQSASEVRAPSSTGVTRLHRSYGVEPDFETMPLLGRWFDQQEYSSIFFFMAAMPVAGTALWYTGLAAPTNFSHFRAIARGGKGTGRSRSATGQCALQNRPQPHCSGVLIAGLVPLHVFFER